MKNISWFLLLLIISSSQISCSSSTSEIPTEKEEIVVKVRGIKIVPGNIEITKTYFGKANYHQSMTYVADISGQVLQSNVKSGQRIKKGDVLFSYPPINHELQIEQALLTFKELKDIYDRQEKLYRIGSVAKVVLTRSRTQMEVQKKELERLERLNLIIAPFSGVVTDVFIRKNEEVEAEDKICSIANTRELKVSFYVPLKDINQISNGNPVYMNCNGQEIVGKVSQKAIQMNPSKRLFHIEASFNHLENFNGAGATYQLRVVTGNVKNSFLIPRKSVKKKRDGYYSYFIKNNKAVIRKLQYECLVGMDFMVKDGMKEGDLLITEGIDKLENNQRVELIK